MVNWPTSAITILNVTDDVSVISAAHIENLYEELNPTQQQLINLRESFKVYRSGSNQSFNNGASTKVQFNGASLNPGTIFDISSNYRFDVAKTGWYEFLGSMYWSNFTVNSALIIEMKLNGTVMSRTLNHMAAGANFSFPYHGYFLCTAGQYVEVYITQYSGAAKNLYYGEAYTWLSGKLSMIP